MDPQIANTFLKYEQQCEQLRKRFLRPRTVHEIKTRQPKKIEMEFDVLSSANISNNIFNLKNKKMNRYIDILAYEHSRVKLQNIQNYYINANQVKSLVDGKIFAIFSQAPVQKYDNFWEAVYYKNVTVVVMLCSFYDPKRGHQSEQYWPDSGNHATFSSGTLKVTNTSTSSDDQQFVVSKFQISGPLGVRKMTHLHWMGWSDLKKPVQSNISRFEQILNVCIQQIQKNNLIWIHCSAGIGRTGTLGGIIQAVRLNKSKKLISIFQIVENMRKYRYHAVQTFQQYRFMYQYLGKKLVN